jgi:hypothetical protein
MAANAGLPFILVGRNMSAASLTRSLADLISPQGGSSSYSNQGQGSPASPAKASVPVMSPREMRSTGVWKEQMLSSLGLSSSQHQQLHIQQQQQEEERASEEAVLAGAK